MEGPVPAFVIQKSDGVHEPMDRRMTVRDVAGHGQNFLVPCHVTEVNLGFREQLRHAVLTFLRPDDIDDGGAFRFEHLTNLVGDALLVGHAEDDDGLAVESEKTHASPPIVGPSPTSAMATTNSVPSTFRPSTLTEPSMISAGPTPSRISASMTSLAPGKTGRRKRAFWILDSPAALPGSSAPRPESSAPPAR